MRFALLLCLSRLVLSIHGQQNAADVDVDSSSSSSISLEFDGMSDEESQRHKRALGILLQGFMEALGYQVSPIQIATLPTAAQNPVAAAAAPPMMQLMPNGSSMPAAPTPRQRETLRFTGVFNFGNNVNATNLVDHLAQYERIFHGNNTTTAPSAASSGNNKKSKKKSKKPKKPPIPDPLFVKIPLPIAPDLPAAQPMPDDHEFYDQRDSHEQHLDEFHESDDEGGKHGHYQEEHDDSRHSEEYQKNHDEHYEDYEPYNRNYPGKKGKEEEEDDDNNSRPKEKLTEYKNNRNVVNYRVENKELHHPDEVAEEVPPLPMSPPLTTLEDVDGPASDWREVDEKRALEVAAEQEALAEALAEKNAERESEARTRQRERDDEGEANYEAADKLLCDENCEDYGKSEEDVEEAADDNANKENNQRSYQARPVVAQQRGGGNEAKLRDSYGKSLQDAEGGPIDERLSGYFSMFKDPDSGLYDPDRIKEYESARLPFYDYSEFLDGFNKIQRQMSGNKYEEYDIDKSLAGDLRAEHRSREEEVDNRDATSRSANECKCDKSGEERQGSTTRSFGPGAQKSVAAAAGPGLPSTTFSPYFFASYDPYETKEEIIARLTSYEPITRPASAALFSADDAARASLPPPPIGFAAERLLHDAAEIKEIESWPEARPSPSTETLNLFRPAQQGLTTASTRKKQQNLEIVDENNRTPWVPLVPIDAKRRSSFSEQQQRSQSKLAAKATLNSYEATTTTTTSTTTTTTTSRPTNHRSSYDDSGGGGGTTKRPSSSSFLGASLRNFLPSTRRYHYQSRSPRPTKTMKRKKKKYDFYTTKPATTKFAGSASAVVPTTTIADKPTSNYVDGGRGDGVPLIAEPTPYYYDERVVGPFAEELLSQNTNPERGVNVKEYRNHVESVKVTEQRLRPEGTTQRIFKYTRRL